MNADEESLDTYLGACIRTLTAFTRFLDVLDEYATRLGIGLEAYIENLDI
jgi:hypothetical protein